MDFNFSSPIHIDNHRLLFVKGPDAFKFIQGQVTCDVERLRMTNQTSVSTLGAHCNPKGRILFSFRACALAEDTIALAIHNSLLKHAKDSLHKYSIFSKVELIEADDTYRLFGLLSKDLEKLSNLFPDIPTSPGKACHHEGNTIISIGEELYECWIKSDSELICPQNDYSGGEYWEAIQISHGIGHIRPDTVEEFIPQMLNYQVIGEGISFKKGCYTGQEVVARMQYLGKLKRRLFRFESDVSDLKPGTPLFTPGNTQAIGQIVQVTNLTQPTQCLAVVAVNVAESDKTYIDIENQKKLRALTLPYAINKEE